MIRTPFIAGLISLLSLGALGASGRQAFKLRLTPTRTNKGWPFNGKNRAQRARLASGFMAML
jgi:hypothetical protein